MQGWWGKTVGKDGGECGEEPESRDVAAFMNDAMHPCEFHGRDPIFSPNIANIVISTNDTWRDPEG